MTVKIHFLAGNPFEIRLSAKLKKKKKLLSDNNLIGKRNMQFVIFRYYTSHNGFKKLKRYDSILHNTFDINIKNL